MTISTIPTGGAELDAERKRLEDDFRRLVDESQTIATRCEARGYYSDGDRERLDRVKRGIEKLDDRITEIRDTQREELTDRVSAGRVRVEAGAENGQEAYVAAPDTFDRARAVIDGLHSRGTIPGESAERAEGLVTAGGLQERTKAARWVEVTARPAYERAFAKLVADPAKGHLLWTRDEHEAYRDVEMFRAMSLTDAAGGYLVPFQLDPAVMLTSDGSINPIRRIARTVTATGDVWNGVSSAGVTAEWLAEAAQAADASPTLAQPAIPIHKGAAFIPFSFEVGQDGADFLGEMRRLLTDGADQLQATAFTTGSGIGQPTGIVTALTGGASVVASATADTFAAADVYALQNALPARFQERAQWAANLTIINTASEFVLGAAERTFPEIRDDRLLRKPLNECSNMDGTITALADNYVLVYGDWSNYVIAARIGATIELIPNLMGANQRPTGQRGALLWFRVGADSVVDESFRVLNVT